MRYLKHIPRSIIRLSSSPYIPSGTNGSTQNCIQHLAVRREGGSVELVSINEKWKCVGIVEGMKTRVVDDAMAWTCGVGCGSVGTTNS